jgi:hypothetical protein
MSILYLCNCCLLYIAFALGVKRGKLSVVVFFFGGNILLRFMFVCVCVFLFFLHVAFHKKKIPLYTEDHPLIIKMLQSAIYI